MIRLFSVIFDTFSDPIWNQSDDFGTLCGQIQNLGPGTNTLHRDASHGDIPIGRALAKMVEWCVRDGIVPKEWMTDEDWPMYHVKLLQQTPVAHTVAHTIEEIFKTNNNY